MTKATTLFLASICLIFCGALWLRLPDLDARPLHADESVHTVKCDRVRQGEYRYDPYEYHGPTLYYLTLPSLWLAGGPTWGDSEISHYRRTTALAGALLILLLLGLRSALGNGATLIAAILLALSPAMVFYSRYYIQEMLLVLFTSTLLVAGWQYTRHRTTTRALLAGLAAGLMYATKETSILAFFALAGALAGTILWHRFQGERGRPPTRPGNPLQFILAGATALLVASIILSGLGTNWSGPLDSIKAYTDYFHRGGGGENLHNQPWYFYLHRLLWFRDQPGPVFSEALILILALIGGGGALLGRGMDRQQIWPLRFIALFTLLLTGVYTVIPYKTPWCLVGFLFGMILLSGSGALVLLRRLASSRLRLALALIIIIGMSHLGRQALAGNAQFAADPRNPYVYAHSVKDTIRLGQRIEELAALHAAGKDTRIDVIIPDGYYWPLPWYLRRMAADRIAYWPTIPKTPLAPIVVAASALGDDLTDRLDGSHHISTFGFRPGVHLLLFTEKSLWQKFLTGRQRTGPLTHRAMATAFQLTIVGQKETYARQCGQEAFALLDRLAANWSRFKPNSEVAKIANLPREKNLTITPDLLSCLLLARRICRETDGAFDPTIPPGKGMEGISLNQEEFTLQRKDPNCKLDLGGIGKGFALDLMAKTLKEWGVTNLLLQGGHSSVLALGAPTGRTGWPVRLAHPNDRQRTIMLLTLKNEALGASGSTTQEGHIIDPKTGKPVTNRLATWVIAPTAGEADALATAFMVMSTEKVRAYCSLHKTIKTILVDPSGDGSKISQFGF